MTIIEYTKKLGLNLSKEQKAILEQWQEAEEKGQSFIMSLPRMQGRQMLLSMIQEYKGYKRGIEESQSMKLNADGCQGCAFELDVEEWELPCVKCKRNCKDYWRAKA